MVQHQPRRQAMLSDACCGICTAIQCRLWVASLLTDRRHALTCRYHYMAALQCALLQAILAAQMFLTDMQGCRLMPIPLSCLQVQC